MRFEEFRTKPNIFIDYLGRWLTEHLLENSKNTILEVDDEELYLSYLRWLDQYLTDPNDLEIGGEYYPISLRARPMAKELKVHYADYPVTFLGVSLDSYVFKNDRAEYQVPMNYTDFQFGSLVMTTIVYLARLLRAEP